MEGPLDRLLGYVALRLLRRRDGSHDLSVPSCDCVTGGWSLSDTRRGWVGGQRPARSGVRLSPAGRWEGRRLPFLIAAVRSPGGEAREACGPGRCHGAQLCCAPLRLGSAAGKAAQEGSGQVADQEDQEGSGCRAAGCRRRLWAAGVWSSGGGGGGGGGGIERSVTHRPPAAPTLRSHHRSSARPGKPRWRGQASTRRSSASWPHLRARRGAVLLPCLCDVCVRRCV